MSAEGRTRHLEVLIIVVPVHRVHVQRGGGAQEVRVLRHVHVQVCAVRAEARVQPRRAAGA
ncbi:hypothetical protein SDC9_103693 [bioreactor metagenome]|uniref:Uncharacterized protein n=1 Tax=bioreactor metagenome TaxID=1076179 RepID=A0A645AUT7_9ZZZZ